MRWECERACGAGGSKQYASAADARRYASELDRRDGEDLGKRAPFLGMFPLRIYRALRRRGSGRS